MTELTSVSRPIGAAHSGAIVDEEGSDDGNDFGLEHVRRACDVADKSGLSSVCRPCRIHLAGRSCHEYRLPTLEYWRG